MLEEAVGRLHCDGYELLAYPAWCERSTREDIAKVVNDCGALVYSVHTEKEVGDLISRNAAGDREEAVKIFQRNCELAEQINANLLVLHLWGGMDSDREIENNLSMYPKLLEISESYGCELTVENIVCNRQNPLLHLWELVERFPSIKFTIDTRMTAFHEQFPELYSATMNQTFVENQPQGQNQASVENQPPAQNWLPADSVRHVHFSDYGGGYMEWARKDALELGDGHIDFESFFRFLKQINYRGAYVLESTCIEEGFNCERLNRNLDFIISHL